MKIVTTLPSRLIIHIQKFTMLISVVFPLLLFFTNRSNLSAQTPLNDNGTTSYVYYSGTFADFQIPYNPRITEIQFYLKGGDGGYAKLFESDPIFGTTLVNCKAWGGTGAEVNATISVGTGPGQVPHGSTIRFIVGGAGESEDGTAVVGFSVPFGAGGGGGTAVLYNPAGTADIGIIAAAGGGGGGYNTAVAYVCSPQTGQGGRSSEDAGSGGGLQSGYGGTLGSGGGEGGVPPAEISGGGGGAYGDGEGGYCIDFDGVAIYNSGGGIKGMPAGGVGGSEFGCDIIDWYDGGYGFGGGGGGFSSAGGGGGYSGGGGGGVENIIDSQGGNGGGGGSYLASFATGTKTAGGATADPANGLITYKCILNEPPVAICVNTPTTVQLNMGGIASIGVGLIDNGSYDFEGDPMTMTLDQEDFHCGDVGSNIVTLSVTDGYNTSTCTSEIIVKDLIAPILFCEDKTVQLDENGYAQVDALDLVVGVYENCAIDQIYLSKDVFGCGDVGENPVILYASDVNGNLAACDASIFVQDVTPPDLQCHNLSIPLEDDGTAIITPGMVITYLYDACGIGFLGLSQDAFSCMDVGDNLVVLTAIDGNGNESTCEVTIGVIDVTPPSMICNNVTIEMDASGNAFVTPEMIDGGIYDACGLLPLYLDVDAFSCYLGDYNVVLTATDVNFNQSTCEVVVSVVGVDEDCDTVHDACDLCNGGNDLIDNNMDGIPDCSQALAYDEYLESWQCGKDKILVCHYGKTKCVKTKSIAGHLEHGDYVGPCNDANCGDELAIDNMSESGITEVEFRIFPNPANNLIQVEANNLKGVDCMLFIQDQLGRLIMQRDVEEGRNSMNETIDVSGFVPGIYYVKMRDGEDSAVRKLIIAK